MSDLQDTLAELQGLLARTRDAATFTANSLAAASGNTAAGAVDLIAMALDRAIELAEGLQS